MNLKLLREKRKLTQNELAEKLQVSKITVSQWEQGRREPSLKMVIKIAKILSCSCDELLVGGEETFVLCSHYDTLTVKQGEKELAVITSDQVITADGVSVILKPSEHYPLGG